MQVFNRYQMRGLPMMPNLPGVPLVFTQLAQRARGTRSKRGPGTLDEPDRTEETLSEELSDEEQDLQGLSLPPNAPMTSQQMWMSQLAPQMIPQYQYGQYGLANLTGYPYGQMAMSMMGPALPGPFQGMMGAFAQGMFPQLAPGFMPMSYTGYPMMGFRGVPMARRMGVMAPRTSRMSGPAGGPRASAGMPDDMDMDMDTDMDMPDDLDDLDVPDLDMASIDDISDDDS